MGENKIKDNKIFKIVSDCKARGYSDIQILALAKQVKIPENIIKENIEKFNKAQSKSLIYNVFKAKPETKSKKLRRKVNIIVFFIVLMLLGQLGFWIYKKKTELNNTQNSVLTTILKQKVQLIIFLKNNL